MAFKSVENFSFLQRISAILESTSYKYNETFLQVLQKFGQKKKHSYSGSKNPDFARAPDPNPLLTMGE